MRLTELEFGSLLAYCPNGESQGVRDSKDVMNVLKTGGFLQNPPPDNSQIAMSEWVAKTIDENKDALPFSHFFHGNVVLVPIPRSSLVRRDSLWVPYQIAESLTQRGLGSGVVPCLKRTVAVPKSALSRPSERPRVTQHFSSLAVEGSLTPPEQIVLVDDIVTRGHTMLGAANRLLEAFPDTRFRGFAAMRTISDPQDFRRIYDPCIGNIRYRETSDDTLRRP